MISNALSYYFMILVIISSFPVVSTLRLPQKAMAQTPASEGAKVLVDDIIQDLKSNNTVKAQVHMNILNQQLPMFVNSSSIQSVKVLLDDATSALKNNEINNAIIHLNLIKQQLTLDGSNTTAASSSVKETTPIGQANHPPTADNITITINTTQPAPIKLEGNDIDGDHLTYSIVSDPSPSGDLSKLNPIHC